MRVTGLRVRRAIGQAPGTLLQSLVTFLIPDLATAVAVALLAGLMRGFAGFGLGMLMAPVYGIVGLQASHGAR